MRFCRMFGISPLDWPEQPADTVIRWSRMLSMEGDEAKRRAELDRIRGLRPH